MKDRENQQIEYVPEWLLKKENYIPKVDKDKFISKSITTLLGVVAKLKCNDYSTESKYKKNVTLQVGLTFLLILLVSITKSFVYVIVVNVYILLILSMTESRLLLKILKMSLCVTIVTLVIMIPALYQGNTYSAIMITSKVFATITLMGILTTRAKWNEITEALRSFHIPNILILILDITMKYIYILGELSINLLYALKLRSVGKNRAKYSSIGGIIGGMFLQSKEMSEEMYQAMECRGFSGEYSKSKQIKLQPLDYLYGAIHIVFLILFMYFERIFYART